MISIRDWWWNFQKVPRSICMWQGNNMTIHTKGLCLHWCLVLQVRNHGKTWCVIDHHREPDCDSSNAEDKRNAKRKREKERAEEKGKRRSVRTHLSEGEAWAPNVPVSQEEATRNGRKWWAELTVTDWPAAKQRVGSWTCQSRQIPSLHQKALLN